MDIVLPTDYVLSSEPCVNLAEVNLVAPNEGGGTAWHRFEIIYLVRDGLPREYRGNMGLAKKFKASQIRVRGGVGDGKKVYQEHTVGEVREMARDMREKPSFTPKELAFYNLEGLI